MKYNKISLIFNAMVLEIQFTNIKGIMISVMENEIKLRKAVLHVLDNSSNMFVLSNGELEMTGDLAEYFTKHIGKIIDDPNIKSTTFTNEENDIKLLLGGLSEDNFISITLEIANKLFDLMQKYVDIPSADLICCIFEENGCKYFGILKLNYKTGFTHWVDNSEEGNVNNIIRYKTLLPQDGQRIDECVLVNLSDYSLRIIEKQYEINGEKEFYLTKYFLKCEAALSVNEKLKILDKVSKKINKEYFDEDYEKTIKLKKAVSQSLEDKESIHIEQIAEEVYDNNADIKSCYIEEIQKAGITEKEIALPEKLIEKKFKIQKIKTDTGIEVNFPLEYTDKRDKIEFINNPDGTISILIKNVGKILNR